MEDNIQKLKKYIEGYLLEELSKDELGRWADRAYYDLLRGGYVEVDKLITYPFLRKLSQFHIKPNDIKDIYPCSEEKVRYINKILNGQQNFEFQIEIGLPVQVYNMFKDNLNFDLNRYKLFVNFRKMIYHYLEYKNMDDNHLTKILNLLYSLDISNKTIYGMLEKQIIKICKIAFEDNSADECISKKYRLYATTIESSNILNKLIEYVDCYTGERNFNIMISIENGIPELFLLI